MNDPDYEREIAQEAYIEGRDHGYSELPNCPHPMGCTEHRFWWRGYQEAKEIKCQLITQNS